MTAALCHVVVSSFSVFFCQFSSTRMEVSRLLSPAPPPRSTPPHAPSALCPRPSGLSSCDGQRAQCFIGTGERKSGTRRGGRIPELPSRYGAAGRGVVWRDVAGRGGARPGAAMSVMLGAAHGDNQLISACLENCTVAGEDVGGNIRGRRAGGGGKHEVSLLAVQIMDPCGRAPGRGVARGVAGRGGLQGLAETVVTGGEQPGRCAAGAGRGLLVISGAASRACPVHTLVGTLSKTSKIY